MTDRKSFIFVGNQAALDFINTRPNIEGRAVELLETFSDLLNWFVEGGLLTEKQVAPLPGKFSDRERNLSVKTAQRFRAALLDAVRALIIGKNFTDALTVINRTLQWHAGFIQLKADNGRLTDNFVVDLNRAEEILAILRDAVVSLLCEIDPVLVRKCENPDCVLYFYDTSKNHRRRWCSMDSCGNRNKVALHYRKWKHDPEK